MTNSMIPYSFIPGTKAKASEVNANFIALAELINSNKNATNIDIEKVYNNLALKAEKTELINEHTVSQADTDLNDYKTKGTYIFTSLYTPLNIPKGEEGTLIVTGDKNSTIKQIWFCTGKNPEIFTRNYTDSSWSTWNSTLGTLTKSSGNIGYHTFPNGLIIQWGNATGSEVTYPIAYSELAVPLFAKNGWAGNYERSDTGFSNQSLTGFDIGSAGVFKNMNWIVIGY